MLKKIICGILTMASVTACAATFTACETSHPEVEMQLEFNGKTYTLEYKLYRKLAPATVEHFLYLADEGNRYYDGLCIHDYGKDALYTGAYSLTDGNALEYKDYYAFVKDASRVGAFPHSVWEDKNKSLATYTLKGEFKDNKFSVKSGALKQSFGSLTMYYHDKSTTQRVYVAGSDSDDTYLRDYEHNSATSMFYISMSTTQTTKNEYCTFATLQKDSVDVLEDLQKAISDYIANKYSDDESHFIEETSMRIDGDDAFVGEMTSYKTFNVPKQPIVIKHVKVTKY